MIWSVVAGDVHRHGRSGNEKTSRSSTVQARGLPARAAEPGDFPPTRGSALCVPGCRPGLSLRGSSFQTASQSLADDRPPFFASTRGLLASTMKHNPPARPRQPLHTLMGANGRIRSLVHSSSHLSRHNDSWPPCNALATPRLPHRPYAMVLPLKRPMTHGHPLGHPLKLPLAITGPASRNPAPATRHFYPRSRGDLAHVPCSTINARRSHARRPPPAQLARPPAVRSTAYVQQRRGTETAQGEDMFHRLRPVDPLPQVDAPPSRDPASRPLPPRRSPRQSQTHPSVPAFLDL